MTTKLGIFISATLLAAPALAQPSVPVPGFWQLEQQYAQDPSLAVARANVASALPPGTALSTAEQALSDAGATCKQKRRRPGSVYCLIHQYSLADGAADDIRWTVALHTDRNAVSDLELSRYVDRHGPN